MAATEEGTTPNGEPNLSAAECTTRTTSDDQDSNYDTLGLHWEDGPREGGVLPNAEVSIEGGVSAITTPEHYVPLAQIKVPQNQEVMINNNKPIVSNSIIEEISSTHATISHDATICSTITYEERIEIAKRYLQAGLKVRFMMVHISYTFKLSDDIILPLTHNIKYIVLYPQYQRHLVVANLILLHPASPQVVHN